MSDFSEGKPENYQSLKSQAADKSSWRNRKAAVEELGKWKCKESIDILWSRMMSDKVYNVQRAAFLALQGFGEKVKLPKKKKGHLVPKINEKLAVIKKSLPSDHDYADFKSEFLRRRPIEYDAYEGDKGAQFDKWLENVWKSLPRKL